jgi:hypothetical protein
MSSSDELTADMRTVFGADVAWAMGGVEAERDWDKSSPQKFVQKTDPATELRVWTLVVADPASQTQRKVKILCDDEPVVPEPSGELPFVAVEFVGLTVRPWLNDRGCKPGQGRRCGCRVELSVRARGVRAARPTRPAPMPASGANRGTGDAAA